jgi:hypothetical protein
MEPPLPPAAIAIFMKFSRAEMAYPSCLLPAENFDESARNISTLVHRFVASTKRNASSTTLGPAFEPREFDSTFVY